MEIEARIKTDLFNPVHYISLARAYLEEGDEERARKIIATKRRLPSENDSVHFEWGRLCEELGMARQAVESYEKAIALNPHNPDYHFRIALLYYERGAWERVLKHLQKTISLSPENLEAKGLLSNLYEEMGLKGLSQAIQGKKEKEKFIPRTLPFQLQKEDASVLLSLFQGREFGYARYKIGEAGHLEVHFIDGLFGYEEIFKHIKGDETLGVYPLRSDKTVKFSVIRIRIPRGRLLANIKNDGFLAITEDHIHHYAKRIYLTMKGIGLPGYMENSGGRERRIWFFFEEFIPYEFAERFLHQVLNQVLTPGVDLAVDFLLGFKGSGVGWVDEPVLLPLGINLETGKRCYFLNEEGVPHEDQLLFIHKIRRISLDSVRFFIKSMRPSRTMRP
ncbi:MAG: tetratricopeptide repeat protein, partial [Candidatus Methanomethylicaceae archaeon]